MGSVFTKGILIDWGHTLVDMAPMDVVQTYLSRHLKDLFKQRSGQDVPLASVRAVLFQLSSQIDASFSTERTSVEMDLGRLYQDCLATHGIVLSGSTLEEVLELEHQAWARHIAAREDTSKTIAELRRRGYRLAIVSNTLWRSPWAQVFPFISDKSFDVTVLSSEVGLRKPHPIIYFTALKAIGLSPGEVAFVGDRIPEDIRGPKELGIPCTVLTHEFRQEEDELKEADCQIYRFSELLNLF